MKECPDCGAANAPEAVTCSECGSLFADQIGVEARRLITSEDFSDLSEMFGADTALPPSAAEPAPEPDAARAAVSVCRSCGALGVASQTRCASCGSKSIALQLAPTAPARTGRFLSAWDRRPKVGVLDADAPELSKSEASVYLALGALKLVVETYLAGVLVFGRIGPYGLQYATYVWRYPLGVTLFVDAFLSGFGAWALFNARRYGATLLSTAFALDVVLLGWLVFHIATERIVVWPASGPYVFVALVCLYCAADAANKALRGNLR
jgi:ribosomal protein L40E